MQHYTDTGYGWQARTQGMFAAHAMAGVTDEMAFGFNFELFTHVTSFCGRKVVLLGLYNGQGLEEEPETDMVSYSRTTEVRICLSVCAAQTSQGNLSGVNCRGNVCW